jgi:hypothetical protein
MDEGNRVTFARRRKLIDRGFQYRTIATWLAVVLAGCIAGAALVCVFFWVALAREGAATGARVAEGLESVMAPLLLNDLAIMFLVIAAGIAATHRIAGPVYRIESDIDRVLAGEGHARVRLRRGDAFPELAGKVNELIARLDDARRG